MEDGVRQDMINDKAHASVDNISGSLFAGYFLDFIWGCFTPITPSTSKPIISVSQCITLTRHKPFERSFFYFLFFILQRRVLTSTNKY